MANAPRKPAVPMTPAYIKSDSLQFDTSKAPWMKFAVAELGKEISERKDDDGFARMLYYAAVQEKSGQRSYLIKDIARKGMGDTLQQKNPEIVKYFRGVKTDPSRDPGKRGRSWDVAPVYEGSPGDWRVTAWCAAFVNWCLKQAGAPHLGYATAASWLQFGTPLPSPVYGCITIIPPSANTKSTTGHVAFYSGTKGDYVVLVGGNQGDKVSEMETQSDRILGYRWPTTFNYYLLDRGSTVV